MKKGEFAMRKLIQIAIISCLPFISSAQNINGIDYYLNGAGTHMTASVIRFTKDQVRIPAKITYQGATYTVIDIDCYATDSDIKSLVIENGPTQISGYSFKNCKGLTELNIPGSIKDIGVQAFEGCTNIKSITLGYGVERIHGSAFSGTAIKTVHIPATVNSIGGSAFLGCPNLTSIYFESEWPPLTSPFSFIEDECQIYVPSIYLVRYKKEWSALKDRIHGY